MCLVEWILGMKKKKGRENEEGKLFGGCFMFGWKGKRENEGVFSTGPQKSFLPKMERKFGG